MEGSAGSGVLQHHSAAQAGQSPVGTRMWLRTGTWLSPGGSRGLGTSLASSIGNAQQSCSWDEHPPTMPLQSHPVS